MGVLQTFPGANVLFLLLPVFSHSKDVEASLKIMNCDLRSRIPHCLRLSPTFTKKSSSYTLTYLTAIQTFRPLAPRICWSDQLKLDLTITMIASKTRRGSKGRQMVARLLNRFGLMMVTSASLAPTREQKRIM